MNLSFTRSAWTDYLWIQQNDHKLLKRLNAVILDTLRSPFDGIGKPEPLKGELAGCWSRRITQEHRLVYRVSHDELTVVSCRFHYNKV